MLPVDFISRVVAWPGADDAPGWVNVHWKPRDGHGMPGRPFKDVRDFMGFVDWAVRKPKLFRDIYFCLSTQKITGKANNNGRYMAHRHASMALWFKSIWMDADYGPGKGFVTLIEVLQALDKFRREVGLPPPSAIVLTGGGVHVYWISNQPLTPEEWRLVAEGLKAEAIRFFGSKIDTGVIADGARVLRVPGTFNNKTETPRPVKLAHLGDDYDFGGGEFRRLASLAPSATVQKSSTVTAPVIDVFPIPPEFDRGPAKVFSHLNANDDVLAEDCLREDLPLDPAELFGRTGCRHFRETLRSHGKSQSQGLWMLTGLACTWLENGRELFHALANAYPNYSVEETDAMYDRKLRDRSEKNLGWPSCAALEGEGAECAKCPWYNKLKSPLHLTDRVAPPPPSQSRMPDGTSLPDGYVLNEQGIICEIVEKEDRSGEANTHYEPLFMCRLRDFRAQAGTRMMLFDTSLDGNRWGRVEINEATDLINEVSINKALRHYGVKPNTKLTSISKRIITFMTSFMAQLDALKERQVATAYGWLRKEGETLPIGFAYGGRIHTRNGDEYPAGYSDRHMEEFYKPKGDDKAWWELLHIVTAQNHPALEVIIAVSFAAPLAFATGQYNGVVNAWSPVSGAHKSTSIAIGAAVYGNPKLTKERPKSSQKGILRKLGLIKNLPVYWDEINSIAKMAEAEEILSDATEGSGGTKLRSDRTIHEYDEWQTMMLMGANKSLVEFIVNSNSGTDAKLQRVFEFEVEKRSDTMPYFMVDRLTNQLDYNYGQMGMAYAKLLGGNVERVYKQVEDALKRFAAETSMTSEERFRASMAASIYTGAQLANELGCDFHCEEIWQFLKTEFLRQRKRIVASEIIAGTGPNSMNWLGQFIKAYNDNAVWVTDIAAGRPVTGVFVAGVNAQRVRPIHIRFTISRRTIEISRAKFSEWLKSREVDPGSVIDGIYRHYNGAQASRATLAAGTGVAGGAREHTIYIPVPPGHPLEEDLFAHTPPDQRPVTGTVIPFKAP